MLIEQVIEFELKGHGPPGNTCTFTTGYFRDKTKIPKKNLREAMYLSFPYLGQINYKILNLTCQILNVFWTKTVSKRG